MSSLSPVIAALKEMDPYHLAAATVAQYIFGMLWFGVIVNSLHRYFYAADKGVRRPEHAIQRYPGVVVSILTLFSALVRAVIVAALFNHFKVDSMEGCEVVVAITAAATTVGLSRYFADQRPFALVATEGGYEALACVIASLTTLFAKQYHI